jgi:hypothetical protein
LNLNKPFKIPLDNLYSLSEPLLEKWLKSIYKEKMVFVMVKKVKRLLI